MLISCCCSGTLPGISLTPRPGSSARISKIWQKALKSWLPWQNSWEIAHNRRRSGVEQQNDINLSHRQEDLYDTSTDCVLVALKSASAGPQSVLDLDTAQQWSRVACFRSTGPHNIWVLLQARILPKPLVSHTCLLLANSRRRSSVFMCRVYHFLRGKFAKPLLLLPRRTDSGLAHSIAWIYMIIHSGVSPSDDGFPWGQTANSTNPICFKEFT